MSRFTGLFINLNCGLVGLYTNHFTNELVVADFAL